MSKTPHRASVKLRHTQIALETELARIEALCGLGAIAAERMYGQTDAAPTDSLAEGFRGLSAEIGELRRALNGTGASSQD